ncbi:MAG: SdpI family protein [Flavobacteriales bacterium]
MNFYVNLPILIGVIYTLISFITERYPPKKINMTYGYRTRRSMQNQSIWDYAQSAYPKVLMKGGLALIAIGTLLWLMGSSQPVVLIAGIVGMFSVLIFLFVHVEGKLKQFEAENTSRRNP